MLILAAVSLGVAILLIGLVVVQTTSDRTEVRTSLSQLDSYQVTPNEQAMLEPITKRVLLPTVRNLTRLALKVTPSGYADGLRRKHLLAGNPPNLDPDRLLVLKGLGLLSGVLWFFVVFVLLGMGGLFGILLLGLFWAGSFMFPDIAIDRAVEDRRHRIARDLPDLLDLLVISVEAGLGFEQAIERTSSAVPGPLSQEFRRALQEIRIGAARSQALRAMDERTQVPELRAFILAILQADTFGVSIAGILRNQASETRVRRRLKAQELAQKAPVKMLFPLVFCIFPAILIILVMPAVIQIVDVLK